MRKKHPHLPMQEVKSIVGRLDLISWEVTLSKKSKQKIKYIFDLRLWVSQYIQHKGR